MREDFAASSPQRAYVGPDRRNRGVSFGRVRRGLAMVALLGLAFAVAAATGAFGDLGRLTEPENAAVAVLGSAGALALAGLCTLAWHILGRTSAAWLAAAFAIYGLGNLLVSYFRLPHAVGAADPEALAWLPPTSRLVAIILMVLAAVTPEIVSRMRPGRALGIGGAAIIVIGLVLQLVPGAAPVVTSAGELLDGEAVPTGSAVLVALWTTVLVVMVVQGRRRGDPLLWWVALLSGLLVVAEILRWPDMAAAGEASGDALRTVALLLVPVGVAGYLLSVFADQRRALLLSEEASRVAQAKLADAGAVQDELRHEARNALSAIAMATAALQHSQHLMEPRAREELSRAVETEIQRLSGLLDRTPLGALVASDVGELMAPQVTAARAGGATIEVDVPPALAVLADPPAFQQALANLLANAQRHAPGSPVTLRARPADDGVVLRCEDRGPGVPASERQRIFARGVLGADAPPESSGLGLYVAAHLVREQGGTIWMDERDGGGASAAIWLPAAPAPPRSGAQPTPAAHQAPGERQPEPADAKEDANCGWR